MPVIVFNKRTSKYLRRHSGSYRHAWTRLGYRQEYIDKIENLFGPRKPYIRGNEKAMEVYKQYNLKVNAFLIDEICGAEPENARVYATESSATSSVGERAPWVRSKQQFVSEDGKAYILPDYFEIHEIKESFVCVMRPDGSSNCDDEESA